ncbi:type VI immunity family protein, partial [Rahnella contaminans]|uniref:type VI immunity family protein n=1 Tax=Rahnella contaminans TaxID=2703882 RepID=UPI0023D9BBAA
MDFFEKFKQAEYEFTYGALDDPENYNALQVGLVAYFYIDKGYLEENREAIINALERCHQEFGKELKWSFFNDPNKTESYSKSTLDKYKQLVKNAGGDHIDFWCASEEGFEHASDYRIYSLSPADWVEHIHRSLSFFSFHLPIKEIKNRLKNENLLIDLCSLLNHIHGLMGLGIKQCRDREKFQYLEYEIGQEFLGLNISNVNTDKSFRNGIRSINWYTFFNDHWLGKLGGINTLRSKLDDPRIQITSYDGG